jgi:hypothetical protein
MRCLSLFRHAVKTPIRIQTMFYGLIYEGETNAHRLPLADTLRVPLVRAEHPFYFTAWLRGCGIQ